MQTSQQFIKAISNITWSNSNDNTLTSDDGFTLSWGTKFHECGDLPSVQIIAQVRYKDAYLMSWGFTNDETQREFIIFMKTTKFKIEEARERAEAWSKKIGLELLKG